MRTTLTTVEFLKKYTELFLLVLLVAYTIFFNNEFFYYDEPYHLDNLKLLNEVGFGREFLEKMNGPIGPLYAWVFWIFQPLTGGSVVGVRLINIILLLGIIVISRKTYAVIYKTTLQDSRWSLGMMSIPMVYACAGMALTEIPALFMLSVSVYFLVIADYERIDYRWVLSGLFLSLAILGRQPYILLIFPFLLWIWYQQAEKKAGPILLYLLCALAIPCYAFYIWGNIVPENGGGVANKDLLPVNFPNLFLGFGYACLCLFLLDRSLIFQFRRRYIPYGVAGFVIIFLLCLYFDFQQPLMKSISSKIIPPALFSYYAIGVAALMVMIGILFLLSIATQIQGSVSNSIRMLMLVCLVIVVAGCAKIVHQFSSRYVFQAALFLVLAIPPRKQDTVQFFLSLLGAALGFLSLYSYYE